MNHQYRYSQIASYGFSRAKSHYMAPVKLEAVNQIRADILKDIISIEAQMHKSTSNNSANFSIRQTWKEMVSCRKSLLKKLVISLD